MAEPDAALTALLWRIAVNKAALGQRFAAFVAGATNDAADALDLLAHEETSHAHSLLHLLPANAAHPPIQPVTFLQRPLRDWYDVIAVGFIFDTALSVAIAALIDARDANLTHAAQSVLRIEALHLAFVAGWVKRIGGEGGPAAQAMEVASARIWDEALCWLGPQDDPAVADLAARGVVDALPDVWRARALRHIGAVAAEAHLRVPARKAAQGNAWALAHPLPWERWDTEHWRLRAVEE